MAAHSARPIPVLPDVGSIRVSPGLIRPDFSASSIIRFPIRSFTDPPALKNSHLARISHLTPSFLEMLLMRTIGVSPIFSNTVDIIGGIGCLGFKICGHSDIAAPGAHGHLLPSGWILTCFFPAGDSESGVDALELGRLFLDILLIEIEILLISSRFCVFTTTHPAFYRLVPYPSVLIISRISHVPSVCAALRHAP